jgi:hypothetical protein
MIATLNPPGGTSTTTWDGDGWADNWTVAWYPVDAGAVAAVQESPTAQARREHAEWFERTRWQAQVFGARRPVRAASLFKPPAVPSPKIIVRKPQRSLPA